MLFTTHDLLSNTCACALAGHQQSTCTCQATCGAMLRETNTFAMLGTPSKVFGSTCAHSTSRCVFAQLHSQGSPEQHRTLLAAGCWLLAAGCWLLAAGCWLLAAGCWPLEFGVLIFFPLRWSELGLGSNVCCLRVFNEERERRKVYLRV